MKKKKQFLKAMPALKFIVLGYLAIILLGTLLLMLPFATKDGLSTPFSDALFTATSATCVTGLIRFDTFTHWTLFGQLVILFMIQIGGIGFVTVVLIILAVSGKKIGLYQRSLMQDSISAPQLGGIVKMTRFIVFAVLGIEAAGALLLAFDFVPRFGPVKGVYYSIFHSISAFCNGGFDLMGGITGECSSLTGLETDLYANLVLMALITIGGLGFFVWRDLIQKDFSFRKLGLQSKIVLSVSFGLIAFGGLVLYVLERDGDMYTGYTEGQKLLSCFFQSVSARTAGFNSADLTKMSESGLLVMIFLMLIGGSTGSTAGGMKTTTWWVLMISIFATFRRKKNIEAFGRRIDENTTRTAACIFMTYLTMILTSAVIISHLEGLPILTVLFETTSAMATVGITLGITGSLGMVSKMIIAFLMFCGRVGSVTMILAFTNNKSKVNSRLPQEPIQIG